MEKILYKAEKQLEEQVGDFRAMKSLLKYPS